MENYEIRKLAAILFCDVFGYSKMMEKNETQTLNFLEMHNQKMFDIINSFNGKIIKTIGDSILAVFDSSTMAMKSAIEMQESIVKDIESKFKVRIGIHSGEIIFKDEDVFGNGVNIAARLQPLANPGGICISEDFYKQIKSLAIDEIIEIGKIQLKNIEDPILVYHSQIDKTISELEIRSLSLALNKSITGKLERLPRNKEDEQRLVSIFGAVSKKGNWLKSKFVKVLNVFAATKLDLREINFEPGITEINISGMFGAIEIIVSDKISLDVSCDTILGSIEHQAKSNPNSIYNVVISGLVILGSIDISNDDIYLLSRPEIKNIESK